ncbi:ribosomal protein S12 methylthiotransferase RimO [Acrasis kona]|uniref:Ribosomal protein S12 methylthiotransferase RimO n=1 Tax=Acrasis kona TaxID=1008807 RepID=A0AAW2Z3D6_9EUKA
MSDIDNKPTQSSADLINPGAKTLIKDEEIKANLPTEKPSSIEEPESSKYAISGAFDSAIEAANEAIDRLGDVVDKSGFSDKVENIYNSVAQVVEDTGIPAQIEHVKEAIQHKFENTSISNENLSEPWLKEGEDKN